MIGKDLAPIDKSLINFDYTKLNNGDMIRNRELEFLMWIENEQCYTLVSKWCSDYLHHPNSEWTSHPVIGEFTTMS